MIFVSKDSVRLWLWKAGTRTARPEGRPRNKAGIRIESAAKCQLFQQRFRWLKMCAQDIILVKLQITFKANIYKEDWYEECAGRGSSYALQSFWIAAVEFASKRGEKLGPSTNVFLAISAARDWCSWHLFTLLFFRWLWQLSLTGSGRPLELFGFLNLSQAIALVSSPWVERNACGPWNRITVGGALWGKSTNEIDDSGP